MPIWSKPEDEHYCGPCTYRLIVNEQNYCGKTFEFHQRMICHKSNAKKWNQLLQKNGHVQDVCRAIDKNWDNVVIEIIARYPDKIKGVEADELFMKEREIEAIALYNSYHNGLNMTVGGDATEYLRTDQRPLCSHKSTHDWKPEWTRFKTFRRWKAQHSQRMHAHMLNLAREASKSLTATKGDQTWKFQSSTEASRVLTNEFGSYNIANISKACRGIYGQYKHKSVYKGIHFQYD